MNALPTSRRDLRKVSVFQGNRRRVSVGCAGLDSPLVVSAPPDIFPAEVGQDAHVALRSESLHVVPGIAPTTGAAEQVEVTA